MSKLNELIAQAVASIDTTSITARLAEQTADADRIAGASNRAQVRLAEIVTELAAEKTASADKVTAALLDGASAFDAVATGPTREQLESEREVLREALRNLRDQGSAVRAAVDEISNRVCSEIGEATEEIADGLVTAAKASAAELIETLVAISALAAVTRNHSRAAHSAQRILAGLMADDWLLHRATLVAVPDQIREALAPIAALPGIRTSIPAHVVPYDPAPLVLASGMMARGRS